ncbi:MAG: heme-binding protein [Gammaproteobacteria bacterium]|nr:heme-binding protein [Gammaproteobacteria bacterium]
MPDITLDQANRIIAAALAKAREMKLKPLAVAVLDSGGHLKALAREDGPTFLRAQVCQAKAWGALGMGVHSRDLATRYEQETRQEGFINALCTMSGGRVVALPGGLLIRDADGAVLGAVGISGAASEDDELCARAGIEAIGYEVDLD